jgi:hypothetical protein
VGNIRDIAEWPKKNVSIRREDLYDNTSFIAYYNDSGYGKGD